MRFLLIISALVAVAVSLRCYDDITNGSGPTTTGNCSSHATACLQQTTITQNNTLKLYGCDTPQTGFCTSIPNGECRNQTVTGGYITTCCCNTDLCNGADFSPPPTVSLECYSEITKGSAPTRTSSCPSIVTHCFKQVNKYKDSTAEIYGCDIPLPGSTPVCSGISNGKCSSQKVEEFSQNTCCCSGNLCNSGGFFRPLLAASLLVIGRFI